MAQGVDAGPHNLVGTAKEEPHENSPLKTDNALEIRLGTGSLDCLTAASLPHLKARLKDFAVQVLKEARFIEDAEHVGSGPPEITAAHIDEAWWVTRRRVRRSRHPVGKVATRAIQVFGAAGFGIGATHLQSSWGPGLFIVATISILGAFLIEAQLSRSD